MGRQRKNDPSRQTPFHDRLNSLKKLRETDREFAERLGLSPAGLSRLINGGKPDFDTLIAIANKTGVSVGWLAAGEGERSHSESPVAEAETFALDYDLLRIVIETIEEVLQAQRKVPSPSVKAELVLLAYSIMLDEADLQQGSDKIIRLAKLAG